MGKHKPQKGDLPRWLGAAHNSMPTSWKCATQVKASFPAWRRGKSTNPRLAASSLTPSNCTSCAAAAAVVSESAPPTRAGIHWGSSDGALQRRALKIAQVLPTLVAIFAQLDQVRGSKGPFLIENIGQVRFASDFHYPFGPGPLLVYDMLYD